MAQVTEPNPKPFLRWAGSKRKQIPRLRGFWNANYDRYVEPFAGSACLFFSLRPGKALLADKNRDLIETFAVVQATPEAVYDRVVALPRTAARYYLERSRNPDELDPLQRTVRFIYLNRNCFNGIYRTNRDGQFNVPFATSRAGAFVTRDEFVAASSTLQRATLRAWDFGTTLRHVRAGDFVYLDPPYVVESRRVFREYSKCPFAAADLQRLSIHLTKIHNRNAAFLVSYADCRESRLLAKDWRSYRIRVRRHVAGFSGARRAAYELLITNIEPTESD
jgi:DNA adenine methylase